MYVKRGKRYNNDGSKSRYFNSPNFLQQIPRPSGYYLACFGRGVDTKVVLYLQVINKGERVIKFDATRKVMNTIKLTTFNYAYWHHAKKISRRRFLCKVSKIDLSFDWITKYKPNKAPINNHATITS